ncbi:hypothetical protein A0J61_05928 [Choanephora cucurbitarum]|uniref:Uncharacterized protein n=1 Tax=Choanephora cucurbitarum TaxID=101091 RepID=A0A1C7NBK8_9FUNG|nr:hypothetical protein A0J61_05928 [Choanephora cucurbitarum]
MEVKQTFEYFMLLEQQFWRNLDQESIQNITMKGQLKPENMLLYGEFGFTLIGLKHALLVEFCDEKVNILYLKTVIEPVLFASKSKTLSCHLIQHIVTPESDLHGCILVYHHDNLLPDISMLISKSKQEENAELSEDTMAAILDYPGHLPKDEEEIPTFLSVIYFHDKGGGDKGLTAVTSFAIQQKEKPTMFAHFERYKTASKQWLGIDLKLFVQ